MIEATFYNSIVTVQVSGHVSLARLQRKIRAEDLEYDPDRRQWVVRNPHLYLDVPFVRSAYEARKKQLTLPL